MNENILIIQKFKTNGAKREKKKKGKKEKYREIGIEEEKRININLTDKKINDRS